MSKGSAKTAGKRKKSRQKRVSKASLFILHLRQLAPNNPQITGQNGTRTGTIKNPALGYAVRGLIDICAACLFRRCLPGGSYGVSKPMSL